MGMQICPEGVVVVELPDEPETTEELDNIIRCVEDHDGCDVVLDFSNVTILTSNSLAPLMRLRRLLGSATRRLVLCSVNPATRGVLVVTALDGAFDIVEDKAAALALTGQHADQFDNG